jgi:hypothetical protein
MVRVILQWRLINMTAAQFHMFYSKREAYLIPFFLRNRRDLTHIKSAPGQVNGVDRRGTCVDIANVFPMNTEKNNSGAVNCALARPQTMLNFFEAHIIQDQ